MAQLCNAVGLMLVLCHMFEQTSSSGSFCQQGVSNQAMSGAACNTLSCLLQGSTAPIRISSLKKWPSCPASSVNQSAVAQCTFGRACSPHGESVPDAESAAHGLMQDALISPPARYTAPRAQADRHHRRVQLGSNCCSPGRLNLARQPMQSPVIDAMQDPG